MRFSLLLLCFTFSLYSLRIIDCTPLYVNPNSHFTACSQDQPCHSLRQAVKLATSGDTIYLLPGVYTGPENTGIEIRYGAQRGIKLIATKHRESIIDCENKGRSALVFYDGGMDSRVEGIVFQNCGDTTPFFHGGAIGVVGNAPVIHNCSFIGNMAEEGGAIAVQATEHFHLSYCHFTSNRAEGNQLAFGGALYLSLASHINITHCTFHNSTVKGTRSLGGALFLNTQGQLTMSHSSFIENHAIAVWSPQIANGQNENDPDGCSTMHAGDVLAGGAACYFHSGNDIHMSQCQFRLNQADASKSLNSMINGTALSFGTGNNITLTQCEFSSNLANSHSNSRTDYALSTVHGGVLYIQRGNQLLITRSLFEYNVIRPVSHSAHAFSFALGGAIFLEESNHLTISDTLFHKNYALSFGEHALARSFGGALHSHGFNNINITHGVFYHNIAQARSLHQSTIATGGAIAVQSGPLYLTRVTFLDNQVISRAGLADWATANAQGGALFSVLNPVHMYHCKFYYNRANSTSFWLPFASGGALFLDSSLFLYMYESILQYNEAIVEGPKGQAYAAGLAVMHVANVIIQDTRFRGNQVTGIAEAHGAALYSGRAGHLDLKSCEFENNCVRSILGESVLGGAIYLMPEVLFTCSGSRFLGNWAEGGDVQAVLGGALYVGINSNVDLDSVFFMNNRVMADGVSCGGAIAIPAQVEGSLSIKACVFRYNAADGLGGGYGGAVYLRRGSPRERRTLAHAMFWGNTASDNGGALHISSVGYVSLTRCNFTRNHAGLLGGAVWFLQISSLLVSHARFTLNEARFGAGLYITESQTLILQQGHFVQNRANVQGGGISVNNLTSVYTDACSFYANLAGDAGGAILTWGATRFQGEESMFGFNQAGFYGGAFATVSTQAQQSFSLCSFTSNRAQIGGALSLSGHSRFHMCKLRANYASSGGAISIVQHSFLDLTRSVFMDNKADLTGGALSLLKSATLRSNHTSWNRNTAIFGGGISLAQAQAIIHGGSLDMNTAEVDGGALFLYASKLTLWGTKIWESAAHRSGAISSIKSELLLHHVDLVWNTANSKAGGLSVHLSNVTLRHCRLHDNRATQGGAIYAVASSISVQGGHISNNLAKDSGGGCALDSCLLTCQDGAHLEENRASAGRGGAVFAMGSWIWMQEVSMQNNEARMEGGGVWSSNGKTKWERVKCMGNKASYGGALFLSESPQNHSHTFTHTHLISNLAHRDGGAVFLRSSATHMDTAHFISNKAVRGGGVYVDERSHVHMVHGEMRNNTATAMKSSAHTLLTSGGGAMYLEGARFASMAPNSQYPSSGGTCNCALQALAVVNGTRIVNNTGAAIAVVGHGARFIALGHTLLLDNALAPSLSPHSLLHPPFNNHFDHPTMSKSKSKTNGSRTYGHGTPRPWPFMAYPLHHVVANVLCDEGGIDLGPNVQLEGKRGHVARADASPLNILCPTACTSLTHPHHICSLPTPHVTSVDPPSLPIYTQRGVSIQTNPPLLHMRPHCRVRTAPHRMQKLVEAFWSENGTSIRCLISNNIYNVRISVSSDGHSWSPEVEIPTYLPGVWIFTFALIATLIVLVALLFTMVVWRFCRLRKATRIELNQWRKTRIANVDLTSLKIIERIGHGSAGEVFRGELRGTRVAIKRLFVRAAMTTEEDFEREVSVMKTLRHPNVVLFMGATSSMPLLMVSEYMPRGSLYDLIHTESMRDRLTWLTRLQMALDAAKGMLYLHTLEPPLVHRDLKSLNLLVDNDYTVKVADFGLAQLVNEAHTMTTAVGTPAWLAPEVLRGGRYTTQSDIYSFGVVLWELVTLKHPYASIHPMRVVYEVANRTLNLEIPDHVSPPFRRLMSRCLHYTASFRPDFHEVVSLLSSMVHDEEDEIMQGDTVATADDVSGSSASRSRQALSSSPRTPPSAIVHQSKSGANGSSYASSRSRSSSTETPPSPLRNALSHTRTRTRTRTPPRTHTHTHTHTQPPRARTFLPSRTARGASINQSHPSQRMRTASHNPFENRDLNLHASLQGFHQTPTSTHPQTHTHPHPHTAGAGRSISNRASGSSPPPPRNSHPHANVNEILCSPCTVARCPGGDQENALLVGTHAHTHTHTHPHSQCECDTCCSAECVTTAFRVPSSGCLLNLKTPPGPAADLHSSSLGGASNRLDAVSPPMDPRAPSAAPLPPIRPNSPHLPHDHTHTSTHSHTHASAHTPSERTPLLSQVNSSHGIQ